MELGKRVPRVSGPTGWQEEGRTQGCSDMVRDERIQQEGQKARAERQGQLGLARSCSGPRPRHLLCCPSASPSLPSGQERPSQPHSQSLPRPNPPLSPTRKINLLLPFLGLCASGSRLLGAPAGVGATPSGIGFLRLWHVLPSVPSESPLFLFFRRVSGRFVPRLDKIQQEWATQGQIQDTRLRGTGRGDTGQSWVIWAIWSPHSSLTRGHVDEETKPDQHSKLSVQQGHQTTQHLGPKTFHHC